MFRGVNTLATISFGLGLAALSGCSRQPDDRQIVQAIQTAIQKDSAINGEVNVQSALGTVTLNGHVANEAARELAGRDSAVPGVKQVINNLMIAPENAAAVPNSPKPDTSAIREKQRRRERHESGVRREDAIAANTQPPDPAPANSFAPAPTSPPPPPEPAPAPVAAPAPPPPPPQPVSVKHNIPAGTILSVRLIDSLDSSRNRVGDTFRATLNAPIRADGDIAVPAGVEVQGIVADASNAGRFSGRSDLKLELTKLTVHGEAYPLQTEDYDKSGNARGKGTAETVGGGAGLGAIIGAIAGGGKGAAIGGLAGAGAGGAVRGAKGAQAIHFPSETVLTFRLSQPLTVVTTNNNDDTRRPLVQ